MNTKTIMTIKVDKEIKSDAMEISKDLGIPLGTMLNSFLKQLVLTRSFSVASSLIPTDYLKKILDDSRKEEKKQEKENFTEVHSLDELFKKLEVT